MYTPDNTYLIQLIACLKKQIDQLTEIVNTGSSMDKPPIVVLWEQITSNSYVNPILAGTTYVVYLNGVNFLTKDVDYQELDGGGFHIINTNLQNVSNTYVIIR